ncbi:MAG: low molecular weight protein-tyrosine-phosphatase [Spirochaetota bacterium]
MTRVLFVCTGNICRSPLAEAVLRDKLARRGIADRFEVDSAGTVDDHLGERSDPRMRRTAASRGVVIDHRARLVRADELASADLVVGMDDWHVRLLEGMVDGRSVEIRKMRDYDPEVVAAAGERAPDVPDPWYGGQRGFEDVYDMVERSCEALADRLAEGS